MVVIVNSALLAFNSKLAGDVRLQLPDLIVHKKVVANAVDIQDSDEEIKV